MSLCDFLYWNLKVNGSEIDWFFLYIIKFLLYDLNIVYIDNCLFYVVNNGFFVIIKELFVFWCVVLYYIILIWVWKVWFKLDRV